MIFRMLIQSYLMNLIWTLEVCKDPFNKDIAYANTFPAGCLVLILHDYPVTVINDNGARLHNSP